MTTKIFFKSGPLNRIYEISDVTGCRNYGNINHNCSPPFSSAEEQSNKLNQFSRIGNDQKAVAGLYNGCSFLSNMQIYRRSNTETPGGGQFVH